MAKSALQFAGEFLLEECKLLTTTGAELDIKNLVQNINIFEDLFSFTVSGDILLKDTTNIVSNGPILGEERLLLKIQTPQSSPNADTTIDYMSTPLIVYKINTTLSASEGANIVSLNFTTQEAFRNQTSRVSQSYKGQPSDIVEKIIRDKNYLNSKRRLFNETTSNNMKVVYPNCKPFVAIEKLSEQSNSATMNSSPSYLFFETTKGYHFRTIDGLCNAETKFVFRENIPNQLNKQGVIDPMKNLETLSKYNILSTRDTVKNMNSGLYSSKLIQHDLYNKTVKSQDYDYLKDYQKDVHTNYNSKELDVPLVSTAPDSDSGLKISENTDSKLYVSITSAGKHFYETKDYPYQSDNLDQTLQRRRSRISQIQTGLKMQIEVPGQTFIQAGDMIQLDIAAQSTMTNDKYDKQYSGRYLVTSIAHSFATGGDPRHIMRMGVSKDSISKRLPSNGISKSNTAAGRTINL